MELRTLGAMLWAVAAGVSVALSLGGSMRLNSTPANPTLHSFYVGTGVGLVSAIWLTALTLLRGGEGPRSPKYCWSTLGGLVVIPAVVTTPAAQLLGSQLVLMLLLVGMLGAALFFDSMGGKLNLGLSKKAGLCLIMIGVALEMVDAMNEVHGSLASILVYSAACLASGGLYAMQAKMNRRLARDLGTTARSAAFCAASGVVFSLPLLVILKCHLHVQLFLSADTWWIWLLCGFQAAFYTFTLAQLPKLIGYSSVFVLVLGGKLTAATLTDTLGAFRPPAPLSVWRCGSIMCMLIGAISYAMQVEKAAGEEICSIIEAVAELDRMPRAVTAPNATKWEALLQPDENKTDLKSATAPAINM